MHQPNFLPWMGYFHKIQQSDVFIILDDVQYPRGKSVANRNKIKGANGTQELVVPISIPKGNEGKASYQEVNFGDNKWKKKVLKSLEMNYAKAPYYSKIADFIRSVFEIDNFCQMNLAFIEEVHKELNMKTSLYKLSELGLHDEKKNGLIIALCKKFNATTYLSGKGASVYNNEDLLHENNIQLKYQEFIHPNYAQLHGEFISHLSIVDALMNIGFEGVKKLLA